MATITGSTNSSLWTFKLVTTEGAYSIAGNTSPLTVDVYIGRVSSSGSYMYGADISGTVTCTGCTSQTFSYKNTGRVDVAAGGWLKIGTVKFSAVPHNSDGSKTVYVSASFSQSGVTPKSGSAAGNVVLANIPRQATLTSAPDFTDEQNPTIYYSNPAGNAVTIQACISLTGEKDDVIYRKLDPYGTSYTFNLNEVIPRDSKTGHDILRAATTSGKQYRFVTFFVTTTIGNATYYSTLQRTYTVVNCAPELNPTVEDLGDASYLLTNDRSKLIRYFNYPKVTFDATAKKGASIVQRTVTCGWETKTAEGNYAQFNNVSDNTFIVSVTDNRGITTTKEITMDMIPYVYLTCTPSINTELGTDNTNSTIHLTVSGNFYIGSLGAVDNGLTVEYRYKSDSTEYPSEWTTIEAECSDNKYIATTSIENVDYRGRYTIQVRAKDRVNTWGVQAKDEIVKIVPVFDWSENDFNFNVPVSAPYILGGDAPVLPSGELSNRDYWIALPTGTYWYAADDPLLFDPTEAGMPKPYGFVVKSGYWSDFNVLFYTQSSGPVYRLSGNSAEIYKWRRLSDSDTDYPIEQGTSGIWTYRKWNSGLAECWGRKSIISSVNNAWGSLYTTGHIADSIVQFPFTFIEPPTVVAELSGSAVGGFLMVSGAINAPTTTTQTGSYEIARAASVTSGATYTINYNVRGKWK